MISRWEVMSSGLMISFCTASLKAGTSCRDGSVLSSLLRDPVFRREGTDCRPPPFLGGVLLGVVLLGVVLLGVLLELSPLGLCEDEPLLEREYRDEEDPRDGVEDPRDGVEDPRDEEDPRDLGLAREAIILALSISNGNVWPFTLTSTMPFLGSIFSTSP